MVKLPNGKTCRFQLTVGDYAPYIDDDIVRDINIFTYDTSPMALSGGRKMSDEFFIWTWQRSKSVSDMQRRLEKWCKMIGKGVAYKLPSDYMSEGKPNRTPYDVLHSWDWSLSRSLEALKARRTRLNKRGIVLKDLPMNNPWTEEQAAAFRAQEAQRLESLNSLASSVADMPAQASGI